jgi:hypothetical protein
METRQSLHWFSLWAARRACGNGGATTGETQGLSSRTTPKGATRAKVRTSGGLARRLSGIFGKVESSLRHLVHVGAACLDQPSPSPRLSLCLSLSHSGGGAQRGRTFCLDGHARHGHLKRAAEGPPVPPQAMVNVPSLFCARWKPRGASRPLGWRLTHPNAKIDSPIAMLLEACKPRLASAQG